MRLLGSGKPVVRGRQVALLGKIYMAVQLENFQLKIGNPAADTEEETNEHHPSTTKDHENGRLIIDNAVIRNCILETSQNN